MACSCDYEEPFVYSSRMVKAKKQHRCYECNRRIQANETYEYVFSVWDGDVCVSKTCHQCLELRNYIEAHIPCACLLHGNLIDGAIEAAKEYAHEASGLLFGAYRKLIHINRAKTNHAATPTL